MGFRCRCRGGGRFLLHSATASRRSYWKGLGFSPPGQEIILDDSRGDAARSAYAYPLIIRQLLHTTLTCGRGREIVYGDFNRYDYPTFTERLGR